MADRDNNRGIVWKNKYKEKGDKKPDFKGFLNVEGKQYEVAQWYYPEADGKPAMFSVTIKPKEDEPKQDEPKGLSNDDMPF